MLTLSCLVQLHQKFRRARMSASRSCKHWAQSVIHAWSLPVELVYCNVVIVASYLHIWAEGWSHTGVNVTTLEYILHTVIHTLTKTHNTTGSSRSLHKWPQSPVQEQAEAPGKAQLCLRHSVLNFLWSKPRPCSLHPCSLVRIVKCQSNKHKIKASHLTSPIQFFTIVRLFFQYIQSYSTLDLYLMNSDFIACKLKTTKCSLSLSIWVWSAFNKHIFLIFGVMDYNQPLSLVHIFSTNQSNI